MKKFEILQESPKCDRDTNWANAVGKMVLIHFLEAGLPWMLNLFKKKKKKEKHYLWGTIKPGMSVFLAVPIYKSTQIRTRVRTVSMRMYVSTLSVLLKLIHLCKQEQTLGKWTRFSGTPQAAHNNRTVSSKPVRRVRKRQLKENQALPISTIQ